MKMNRVLAMKENGLIDEWISNYNPAFKQCPIYLNEKDIKRKDSKTPLTLNNLPGAFVILCGGCGLSMIVFVGEIVCGSRSMRKLKSATG